MSEATIPSVELSATGSSSARPARTSTGTEASAAALSACARRIGCTGHDASGIELYVHETRTFPTYTDEAVVVLEA
ncbi:hypothetical protein OH809_39885 [Streptomyces sp. NBC_00873]|uniref:hypothetical protein n=1 Tax=unclassified Streptomyces TaxID=2593676 RepID=UPI003868BA4E|nr:hypothetical protein OH809_39885 [Streptomyces sp. NBC_00873]WTA41883.1 hypothetical protein OH821_03810 [Streptomyces sp. NBC_00842]